MLDGGFGADAMDGQAGIDTVTYAVSNRSVGARLDGGANFGGAAGDTITGVENLTGSGFGDILVGSSGANRLDGGGGADRLYALGGDDIVIGGGGADWLYGQAGNDTLEGGDGNDTLFGHNDSDILNGGAGDDVLDGGFGADTFVFTAGADVITDFTDDIDTLSFDAALWNGASLTTTQILAMAIVSVDDIVFDFGLGNTLTLQGLALTGVAALANDISVF